MTDPKVQQLRDHEQFKYFCCASFVFLFACELVMSYYILGLLNRPIARSRADLDAVFLANVHSDRFRAVLEHVARNVLAESAAAAGGGGVAAPRPRVDNRRKRSALVVDDNRVSSHVQGPVNEYLSLQDSQDEPVKDPSNWFWLSGTSRVPKKDIMSFCHESRDFCLPSMKGDQGLPGGRGERGPRGDQGVPGLPGQVGPPGPTGPRGPTGEVGWPGAPGLDGRDGVPGEPGLDGVPGHSGTDGTPGLDGEPGLPGTDGKDGLHGINGKPGPQGPMGPQGTKGLTGPRGRPGKPGNHGTPGNPGISTWMVPSNATNELLIPPSIAGPSVSPRPIVLREGENLRLRCGATGVPTPHVEWRKTDGTLMTLGSWQTLSVGGHTLNITRVNRVNMGVYECIANNGVPSAVNQTFNLEVHFPPQIIVRNQMVAASNGSTARLRCEVEAFPDAIRYWERSDGRLLEHSDKYRIDSYKLNGYTTLMQLNITRVGPHDYSLYHCIAKNEIGITRGVSTVYEIDPRYAKPPPTKLDEDKIAIYGERAPKHVSIEDLCPAPIQCPDCPDPKCRDVGVSLFDLVGRLNIRPLDSNVTYPGPPHRNLDCLLYAVGKPVYHRFTEQTYGAWMRDPLPTSETEGERLWVTKENDVLTLYEFANKTVFRKDLPTRKYTLLDPIRGNAHVIYNGSFYYNVRNKSCIVRFELATERRHSMEVPSVVTNGTADFLYTTEYNYIDFSVDDNGLWIIYGLPNSNNTAVLKVDTYEMKIQYAWNISINHHKVGEMFVVCGVLYAVDSVTERSSRIRLALDLYKNTLLDVNLSFTNPFRKTTMLGYNPRNKELYSWDKGNQLTYPIRYHEIGYNSSAEERAPDPAGAQMQTGYDVYT